MNSPIYTDLIPADYRDGVIGFVAIDQEASGGTDGAMQPVSGPRRGADR